MKIKVNELKNKLLETSQKIAKTANDEAEPILMKMVELQKQLDSINEKHRLSLIESSIIESEALRLGKVKNTRYVYAKQHDMILVENLLSEKSFNEKFKDYSISSYSWKIEI